MDYILVDYTNSKKPWVYWVDFESKEGGSNGIYRVHPDGTELQHIIKDGIGEVLERLKKEQSPDLIFVP